MRAPTDKLADGAVTVAKLSRTGGKVVGLDADTLDGLDSSAFAPAAIEIKVDAIKAGTDGLGALKAELDTVKSSTDAIAALSSTAGGLASASAVAAVQTTASQIKASTDGTAALAATVTAIKAQTDTLTGLAKTTDLEGLAKTSDLAAVAKTADLATSAKTSDVAALSTKVDKLLELLAPTTCPSGMTLIGGTGNKGGYCLDTALNAGGLVDYGQASVGCTQRGLHLCTLDEWTGACGTPGLAINDAEQWVANAPNNGVDRGSPNNFGLRVVVGGGACWNSSWAWAGFGNRSIDRYRCCR